MLEKYKKCYKNIKNVIKNSESLKKIIHILKYLLRRS